MIGALVKSLGLIKDFADAKEWLGKRWFLSKTLWMNAIAMVAVYILPKYGVTLTSEEQGGIIIVMNMVLRIFTNQPLVAKEEEIIPVTEIREGLQDRDLPYSPK